MKVAFANVSIESLMVLKQCLEKRRFELVVCSKNLEKDLCSSLNKESCKKNSAEISSIRDTLDSYRVDIDLIDDLLTQL